MLSKRKKIVILCSMVALLVITGILNVTLNNNATVDTSSSSLTSANFFTTYRTDRTETTNESIMYYEAIIEDSTSSAQAKADAETQRAAIIANLTLQTTIEGLVKAKGFSDCVASCTDTYINVMVQTSADLTDAEVAQIVDIVQGQTQKDIDWIKIIPVE